MKLFLDDIRTPDWVYPGEDWTLVRTYQACLDALRIGTVTELSLDNDLGPRPWADGAGRDDGIGFYGAGGGCASSGGVRPHR